MGASLLDTQMLGGDRCLPLRSATRCLILLLIGLVLDLPCGHFDDILSTYIGGFNTVGARTPFSLGSTYITLASEHEEANGTPFSFCSLSFSFPLSFLYVRNYSDHTVFRT